MANIYWYKDAADAHWDTLGNWWDDAAHTTPASSIPVDSDAVYFLGTVQPDNSPGTPLNVLLRWDTTGFDNDFDCSVFTMATDFVAITNVFIGNGTYVQNFTGSDVTNATVGGVAEIATCEIVNLICNDEATSSAISVVTSAIYNDDSSDINSTFVGTIECNDNSTLTTVDASAADIVFNDDSTGNEFLFANLEINGTPNRTITNCYGQEDCVIDCNVPVIFYTGQPFQGNNCTTNGEQITSIDCNWGGSGTINNTFISYSSGFVVCVFNDTVKVGAETGFQSTSFDNCTFNENISLLDEAFFNSCTFNTVDIIIKNQSADAVFSGANLGTWSIINAGTASGNFNIMRISL